jgi:hypothetical protein
MKIRGRKIDSNKNKEAFTNAWVSMGRLLASKAGPEAKLQMLALMASMEPNNTRKCLKSKEGREAFKPLELVTKDGQLGDIFQSFGAFKSAISEEFHMNAAENIQTIESIYGHLKLGRLSHAVPGGERERLDINESNFSR